MKSPVRRKTSGAVDPKSGRRERVAKDSQGTDAQVAKLREFLARGASVRAAARQLRRPKSTVHDLAARHDLPRRPRCIRPEQVRKLERALAREESLRVAARLAQVSASTVHRRKRTSLGKVAKHRCGGCGGLIDTRDCLKCLLERRTAERPPGRA